MENRIEHRRTSAHNTGRHGHHRGRLGQGRGTPLLNALQKCLVAGSDDARRQANNEFTRLVMSKAKDCCRKHLRDAQVAEEIAQDTAAVVWGERRRLRRQHEGALVSYIHTVAKRRCISHHRRPDLAKGRYTALEDLRGVDLAANFEPDRAARQEGARKALALAMAHAVALIAEQSPRDLWEESGARGVPRTRAGGERNNRVVLRCTQGHSAREVGAEFEITEAAVYQARKRGKTALIFGARRAQRLEIGLDPWTREELEWIGGMA